MENEHVEEIGQLELSEHAVIIGSGTMSPTELEHRQLSNTEFVARVMNFSKFGPAVQPFIIEAIASYCEAVVKDPRPAQPGDGIISAQLWWDLAEDVKRQIDATYKSAS